MWYYEFIILINGSKKRDYNNHSSALYIIPNNSTILVWIQKQNIVILFIKTNHTAIYSSLNKSIIVIFVINIYNHTTFYSLIFFQTEPKYLVYI